MGARASVELALPERWRERLEITPRYESPSSIVTFMSCQLRWFTERHAGVDLGADIKVASTMGTFVHRVLEVFCNEAPAVRTEAMLWQTFEAAWAALVAHDDEEGIVGASLVAEFDHLERHERNAQAMRADFYARAKVCVGNVLEFYPQPQSIKVAGNEVWVKATVAGVTVRGKVDLIEITARGTERIVDWKSGRAPDVESVDVLDPTFVPVGLYALMRERSRRASSALAPEVSSVRLVYLKELRSYTAKITPDLLAGVEEHLVSVVEEMNEIARTGAITATPSPSSRSGACRWCPLVSLCPAWNETTVADMAAALPPKVKAPAR